MLRQQDLRAVVGDAHGGDFRTEATKVPEELRAECALVEVDRDRHVVDADVEVGRRSQAQHARSRARGTDQLPIVDRKAATANPAAAASPARRPAPRTAIGTISLTHTTIIAPAAMVWMMAMRSASLGFRIA